MFLLVTILGEKSPAVSFESLAMRLAVVLKSELCQTKYYSSSTQTCNLLGRAIIVEARSSLSIASTGESSVVVA